MRFLIHRLKQAAAKAIAAVSTTLMFIQPVLAADSSGVIGKFQEAYNLLMRISLMVAIVGLSATALQMLLTETMSEQALAGLKRRVVIIIITIAAIYLLPSFLRMGTAIGRSHAWAP